MKGIEVIMILTLGMVFTGCRNQDADSAQAYQVENIALPGGLGGQVGGLDFLPDGRLAACFSSGEVMFYDPQKKHWQLYAEGLHDPLGIMAISPDTILVMQRPELTRLVDRDHDGKADQYQTLSDQFGISGNYHEFAYGPVKDAAGNLFIALNASSPNGGVMKQTRGGINPLTMDHPKEMFSPVPYRGWVMEYTREGKLLPFASGFRSPNGLLMDGGDSLYVTDNQGDWVPTSTLYLVKKNHFYGHPASLVWEKNWRGGNPYKLPLSRLDSMRDKAVVLFPHGIIASSPSQPVADHSQGKFGPFSGQLFVGEMDIPRIVRVMTEEVDGQLQGACTPFLDGDSLHKGINRLAFAPDGSLWVGQNDHGWAGHRGIQRIRFTGAVPLDVVRMHLTASGFKLTFTLALDPDSATDTSHYKLRHYRYHYSSRYGSDQFDVKDIPITSVGLSGDRKTVSLTLDGIVPGMIYELTLSGLRSAHGRLIEHQVICYTVNRLNPEEE